MSEAGIDRVVNGTTAVLASRLIQVVGIPLLLAAIYWVGSSLEGIHGDISDMSARVATIEKGAQDSILLNAELREDLIARVNAQRTDIANLNSRIQFLENRTNR